MSIFSFFDKISFLSLIASLFKKMSHHCCAELKTLLCRSLTEWINNKRSQPEDDNW